MGLVKKYRGRGPEHLKMSRFDLPFLFATHVCKLDLKPFTLGLQPRYAWNSSPFRKNAV